MNFRQSMRAFGINSIVLGFLHNVNLFFNRKSLNCQVLKSLLGGYKRFIYKMSINPLTSGGGAYALPTICLVGWPEKVNFEI